MLLLTELGPYGKYLLECCNYVEGNWPSLVFPNKGRTELSVNKSFIAHRIQMNQYKMKLMSDSAPFILLCRVSTYDIDIKQYSVLTKASLYGLFTSAFTSFACSLLLELCNSKYVTK